MTVPAPRTWSSGDLITVARLRGDAGNIAEIMCGGRPLLAAGNAAGQFLASGSPAPLIDVTSISGNNWNVPVANAAGTGTTYAVPMTGWYLLFAVVVFEVLSADSPNLYKFAVGFDLTQNSTGSRVDGGSVSGSTQSPDSFPGPAGMDLVLLDSTTSDTVAFYAFQNTGSTQDLYSAQMTAEWVAAKTGTVLSSVPDPVAWPSGPGTYITDSGGIASGATSVTVNDATGIVVDGTLGLDYQGGALAQPYAETVTVTSVSGTTIGITAASYAHSEDAPVAVPVSYAFLNAQIRDVAWFLAYPPILRAAQGSAQSIASTTFPAGAAVTGLSATGGVDNYAGLSSSVYTAAVAGTYLVYGQVYLTGATSTFICSAGVQQNSGTIQWGTLFRTDTSTTAQTVCAWYGPRLMRLSAGDTLTLYAYQNSGSAMDTVATAGSNSRLIAVWRST